MAPMQSLRRPFGGFMVDPGKQQAEAARAVGDRISRHIDRRLDVEFGRLTRKVEHLMAKLQDILDLVAEQRTQIESLNTLADGIRGQVATLLQNASVDQTTQALVDQVFERMKENSGALAEAIAENTAPGTPPVESKPADSAPAPIEPEPEPAPIEPAPVPVEPAPTPVDEVKPEAQG